MSSAQERAAEVIRSMFQFGNPRWHHNAAQALAEANLLVDDDEIDRLRACVAELRDALAAKDAYLSDVAGQLARALVNSTTQARLVALGRAVEQSEYLEPRPGDPYVYGWNRRLAAIYEAAGVEP